MNSGWKRRTRLVHEGAHRSHYGEMAEALFLTQSYVYPDAETAERRFIRRGADEYIYSRGANPTTHVFEERVAGLEGTEDALATASGMAAVNGAVTAPLRMGDHVVSSRALFGSCLYILEDILSRFGVDVTFVDGTDNDQWQAAIRPETRLVFFETMANPTLEVVDIRTVARLAHAVGATLVVDNVFVTPAFSRAVELGADVVVYSATKHIDGSGRALGGVICGRRAFIRDTVEPYVRHIGGVMSPFTAWSMLTGLTTLDLRCRAMAESAMRVATHLEGHEKVANARYPGLASFPQHALAMSQMTAPGTMIAVEIAGGKAGAFRFLDALRVVKISNNLGDARSIACHSATTTHQRLTEDQRERIGVRPGLVRLSIGLEDADDLLADLDQALAAV